MKSAFGVSGELIHERASWPAAWTSLNSFCRGPGSFYSALGRRVHNATTGRRLPVVTIYKWRSREITTFASWLDITEVTAEYLNLLPTWRKSDRIRYWPVAWFQSEKRGQRIPSLGVPAVGCQL